MSSGPVGNWRPASGGSRNRRIELVWLRCATEHGYRFICANHDGEITRLDRPVGNGEWERVDDEPPYSLRVLVRHRLAGGH